MDSSLAAVIITGIFGTGGIIFGQRKGMSRQQRSELVTSDAKWRVMEDYALKCRRSMINAGLTPDPWPEELRVNASKNEDERT